MKIAVIGTGYVGLVSGACFAETGNHVFCVDSDSAKVSDLQEGRIPFYEPGLPELVSRNTSEGRLMFTNSLTEALKEAKVAFVCVGTPPAKDGSADLSHVMDVVRNIADLVKTPLILTIKSTVPVGTGDHVRAELASRGKHQIRIVSNPEFLREGTAVQDCLFPDRVVVGTDDEEVAELFTALYQPYVRTGHPILIVHVRAAELAKYAANAFLATRISFINEISMICDKVGADIEQVRAAVGSDHRIGMQYFFPSIGFGGSCFPKDVLALEAVARKYDVDAKLLRATMDVNRAQQKRFVNHIVSHFGGPSGIKGKALALWGLAFKAKTDDVRQSPAFAVIDGLLEAGAKICVYDPVAMANTKAIYGDRISYAKFSYAALEGAQALCVLTEWNQFRHPDFLQIKELLKTPTIFDGRNLYDPKLMKELGFEYFGIGRSVVGKCEP